MLPNKKRQILCTSDKQQHKQLYKLCSKIPVAVTLETIMRE